MRPSIWDPYVMFALIALPFLIPVLILTIYMKQPRHETEEDKRARANAGY